MADPIVQSTNSQRSNSLDLNSGGFFQSIFDGVFKGDFSPNNSKTKTASQIGVGLIPIAGQVADARDTFAALGEVQQGKSGSIPNLALSLIGWVPLAGDVFKSANKIGFKETFNSIGDAFNSIKNTWKDISLFSEEQMGNFGSLFYKPATDMNKEGLPFGTFGITNRWGDIGISDSLDPITKQSTLNHESVHSFFSPKLKYGQEFRAKLGLLGYIESHLLRRTEEGLAEAWSKFKSDGFSGIKEGWKFPLENDYGIDPERLKIERNILLGIGSTAIGAGSSLGDSLSNNE